MVSANTHFEEWWFKTFFYINGKGGLHNTNKFRPVSFWKLVFCVLSVCLIVIFLLAARKAKNLRVKTEYSF